MDGKTIYVTGSPMKEVLYKHLDKINNSNILEQLGLKKNGYILVSAHREENIDIEENFFELMNSINTIAETYNVPVIYSTHPRSKKWIEKRNFKFHPLVKSMKPFGFFEYVKLQQNALCVLSDSGTLTEESSIMNFPAVLIRTSTERPEGLDAGTIVIGGIKQKDVLEATELAISMAKNKEKIKPSAYYEIDNTSIRVVRIIQSYAKIVKKVTWLE